MDRKRDCAGLQVSKVKRVCKVNTEPNDKQRVHSNTRPCIKAMLVL